MVGGGGDVALLRSVFEGVRNTLPVKFDDFGLPLDEAIFCSSLTFLGSRWLPVRNGISDALSFGFVASASRHCGEVFSFVFSVYCVSNHGLAGECRNHNLVHELSTFACAFDSI